MTAPAPLGLRERKRIATSRAIQIAALTLASERGLDNVTIEDIAGAADVSPRTFFNYFASKDAAILGDGPGLADEEAQERFVSAGADSDVLVDLGEMIATSAEHVSMDPDALRLRKVLHKQYPQLSALFMTGRRQLEEQLTALVLRRLRADDPSLDTADPDADVTAAASQARLITFVAIAAMRHGWIEWANGGAATSLGDNIRQAFDQLQSLRLSAGAK
jgi:AcrR family transcriptional regulator